eukprot:6179187-Pleurochrysis_carterae.AAC.3
MACVQARAGSRVCMQANAQAEERARFCVNFCAWSTCHMADGAALLCQHAVRTHKQSQLLARIQAHERTNLKCTNTRAHLYVPSCALNTNTACLTHVPSRFTHVGARSMFFTCRAAARGRGAHRGVRLRQRGDDGAAALTLEGAVRREPSAGEQPSPALRPSSSRPSATRHADDEREACGPFLDHVVHFARSSMDRAHRHGAKSVPRRVRALLSLPAAVGAKNKAACVESSEHVLY